MFRAEAKRPSRIRSAFELCELIYHATIRNLRKSHGNAVKGLVMSVVQAALTLVIFIVIFWVMGLRHSPIRGDFVIYVMSGVFMFLTHTKALGAVAGADGPTSPMMMHRPMNPVIAVVSAALAALYQQVLAMAVILLIYHTLWTPITIYQPAGALAMLLLSWFSGAAIGLIFYAAKPWQPDVVSILSTIYQRANMIASGKMFVASMLPASRRSLFDWNPLFHTIDQARGYMFLNYNARYTSLDYPIKVALVCILIGLMAEFYTRKHVSASWQKRQ
ncbi:ABC transporter permease [Xinfangfangia sp. CPCC 101601]|uniref:ABC transporter permease n=1 Tax=Pseudogemmobacter lacusdianii TaxID=3069608 RepID=A0ABU0VTP9_9RHOB|nr:ABC transporter permease [Xinfangfangia sp. CPCC 101601]MDQ2065105.1 ABC transporter permease [Xinfangfangia sp. CPCC 101601]